EKDRQGATGYDLTTFMQSNGLAFKDTGNRYTYGPDTTLKTYGIFANANVALTDDLKISAGVRHQIIDSKT
ncbi:TonB-dependent receptor domain-containing protein, partial [Streptococcus pneumoniae]